MEFALLGPVEAPVDLGPARQRAVLAALLLDAPVPVDRLAERVWGPDVPRTARRTLFSYLSRLRAVGVPIERRPAGYVVSPSTVDVDRFRHLVRDGRYDEALALWRGEPFAELDSPWFTEIRAALTAERHAAELSRTDDALRTGRPVDVPALRARCTQHPLDERLAAQYMAALHREGRTADALDHYDRTRKALVEELGLEPGPVLRGEHLAILAALPRQLPARPRAFAARDDDLAQIRPGGITVISGPGGVGKTWLALQWAHQQDFPDGELHADLRGFDPVRQPVPAEVALRGFLRALGADPPTEFDDQVALYRTLTTTRNLLVVLDNARDAEQVVPLLPATGTVLITSRNRLHALVSGHGAIPVALDVLSDVDAQAVLEAHLGAAPAELLELCGGLPLALGIAAARARSSPDLATELRHDRLLDLRSVFEWSLDALDPAAVEVFGLLGRAPGPDVSRAAVTALAGREVHAELRALQDAHLVDQHVPGRYRTHDLVRLFAAEQPADPHAERRIVDFYLGTAFTADRALLIYRAPIDVPARDLPDDPLVWFAAEHACLRAAQQLALRNGWDDDAWRLAWVLDGYHQRRGLLLDLRTMWTDGLAAAQRSGSRLGQHLGHRILGTTNGMLGAHDTALTHLRHARDLADGVQHTHTDMALARVLAYPADYAPALDLARGALRVYQEMGEEIWQALAHTAVGWYSLQLGEYDPVHFDRALALFRKHHDRGGEAEILANLGYVHALHGRETEARQHYATALELLRAQDNAFDEAITLEDLGTALKALGHHTEAKTVHGAAADLYRTQNRMHRAQALG